MSPEQRAQALRRGEQAAEFYELHPFDEVRASIMAEWAKADTLKERRDDLWFELRAIDRVMNKLAAAAQNAKAAALEIKAEAAAANGGFDPYERA